MAFRGPAFFFLGLFGAAHVAPLSILPLQMIPPVGYLDHTPVQWDQPVKELTLCKLVLRGRMLGRCVQPCSDRMIRKLPRETFRARAPRIATNLRVSNQASGNCAACPHPRGWHRLRGSRCGLLLPLWTASPS